MIERLHTRVPAHLLLAGLVAVLLAAAWAVHRGVERPVGRRLKRWLTGVTITPRTTPATTRLDGMPPPR